MNVNNKSVLDLTFSILFGFLHDFSFEVILIGNDVPFPLSHSFFLADPNGIGNLEIRLKVHTVLLQSLL